MKRDKFVNGVKLRDRESEKDKNKYEQAMCDYINGNDAKAGFIIGQELKWAMTKGIDFNPAKFNEELKKRRNR